MGFIASSIVTIPREGYEWYLFMIMDNWNDALRSEVSDNFENLAREVGEKVLVVKGVNREIFHDQLFYKYALKEDVRKNLPALLITDTPPNAIHEDENAFKQARSLSE